MLLFAAGFALAGAHGMGRKMYGAEQACAALGESVGLAVMGVGGFVAVAGGCSSSASSLAAWRLRAAFRVGASAYPLAVQPLEVDA